MYGARHFSRSAGCSRSACSPSSVVGYRSQSTRNASNALVSSFMFVAACDRLASSVRPTTLGMIKAARMARIRITTMSSMSVNAFDLDRLLIDCLIVFVFISLLLQPPEISLLHDVLRLVNRQQHRQNHKPYEN